MGADITTFIQGGGQPAFTQKKMEVFGQQADVTEVNWTADDGSFEFHGMSIEFGEAPASGQVGGITLDAPQGKPSAGTSQSLNAFLSNDQAAFLVLLALVLNGDLNLNGSNGNGAKTTPTTPAPSTPPASSTTPTPPAGTDNPFQKQVDELKSEIAKLKEELNKRNAGTPLAPAPAPTPAPAPATPPAATVTPAAPAPAPTPATPPAASVSPAAPAPAPTPPTPPASVAPAAPAPAPTPAAPPASVAPAPPAPAPAPPVAAPPAENPEDRQALNDAQSAFNAACGEADALQGQLTTLISEFEGLSLQAGQAGDAANALASDTPLNKEAAKQAALRAKDLVRQAKAAAENVKVKKAALQSALERVNSTQERVNAALAKLGQRNKVERPPMDLRPFNTSLDELTLNTIDTHMNRVLNALEMPDPVPAPVSADPPKSVAPTVPVPTTTPDPAVKSLVYPIKWDDGSKPGGSVAPASPVPAPASAPPADPAPTPAPATPVAPAPVAKALNASAHFEFVGWLRQNYAELAKTNPRNLLGAEQMAHAINQWNANHPDKPVNLSGADKNGDGKILGAQEFDSKEFWSNIQNVLNCGITGEINDDGTSRYEVSPVDLLQIQRSIRPDKSWSLTTSGSKPLNQNVDFMEWLYAGFDAYSQTYKSSKLLTNAEIARAINEWNASHPNHKVDISAFDTEINKGPGAAPDRPDGVVGKYYLGTSGGTGNEYDRSEFYKAFEGLSQLYDDPRTWDSYYISKGDLEKAINKIRSGGTVD